MKLFSSILAACLAGWGVVALGADGNHYQIPPNHRLEQTINRQWTFNYFPSENAYSNGCESPDFDDSMWPAVALPHTWQTYETTGKLHPFIHDAHEDDDPYWWRGWGWYRKHFSVSKDKADRRIFIEFDGVQKYCKIFINGKLVGDHKGGYDGFYFDITDWVHFGADNVLAVAVNCDQDDSFKIPPMSAGNWNTYGGIYRDVRIVIKDPLNIPYQGSYKQEGGTFITTPSVSDASGTVNVKTWVQNDGTAPKSCELRTTIADADGNIIQVLSDKKTVQPGQLAAFDQNSAPVPNPHLWSPETPYVYNVFSDVYSDGAAVDHFESPLGFRWFKWDYTANRLILNGKKVIIHGSNHHQEYPWLGDATPKWMLLSDMLDFRLNLNNNFMRTCHYPNDPAIYNFNDHYGIITIEELPNDKRQKFSEDVQVQQLRETIRRDRNHPAILFWSMGNETDDAVDSKYAVAEDTTRIIHARDIYNDSAGQFVQTTSKQLALESMLRCTVGGWFNSDVRNLEPKSAQQAGNEEWQHDEAAAEFIKNNAGRAPDDLANLNTWIYEDHGCDRDYAGAPLMKVNPKGWVDCWREPKYMYYLWQAWYAEKPMVYIHPFVWSQHYLGDQKEIVVDSNCKSVELQVNGRTIGVQEPSLSKANVVRFENVRVEQGTLTAIGRSGDQTVTNTVVMASAPVQLSLSSNPGALEAGLDSLAIVRADIVDAAGVHVFGATNTIHWSVTGPAKLVGAPVYRSDTDKNEATEGTMYIDAPAFNIIRSSGQPGEIKVRIESPGLAPAEISITASPPPVDNSVAIIQPLLPETRRQPVALENSTARQPNQVAVPEMHGTVEDISISANNLDEYAQQIDRLLRDDNPELNFDTPEYHAIVSVFAQHLEDNHGSLVRDDFNFTAGFYNNCCQITRQIDALNLPELFKESLHEHYAHAMIELGEAKNYDTESRWLASLPNGKLVVGGASPNAVRQPGVIYTDKTDLPSIVALAQPEFENFSATRQAAFLKTVRAINPNVKRKDGTGKTAAYAAVKGEPILVPDLNYFASVAKLPKTE
jgi:beta-galactosidase